MTSQGAGQTDAPLLVETFDRLRVEVHRDRPGMGRAAARRAAEVIGERIDRAGTARVMFASAPSQDEFLDSLTAAPLDWSRVEVFHMDEYLGVPSGAPQAFSNYLRERLIGVVRPGRAHLLDGTADPATEAARYATLLAAAPLDLVCCGVGENGHLAFNDPGVADFDDRAAVKRVELSEESRRQQVHDGTFPDLEAVPGEALTVTVPVLFGAGAVTCVVPGPTKRSALDHMLRGPITEACPATILRRHADCVLYTDRAAFEQPAPAGGTGS